MPSANSHLAYLMSDQVLPSEVSAQSDTWLNRYRNYPVFSRTWFRYRATAFVGSTSILIVLFSALYVLIEHDVRKILVIAIPIFCGSSALSLIGQFIAVRVRQKNFSARKEACLLIVALCFGAALSAGIYAGLRYSAKYVAYGNGDVLLYLGTKEQAQEPATRRSKLAAIVGQPAISETDSPKSASNTSEQNLEPVVAVILSIAQFFPTTFLVVYFGSGFDLWVFFRQRKKLAEALRQQELSRAQEARREAELRLSVLVAQVEPHFLFNTLAGVRSAILTEPARATAIVDHLVDYLRATIPQMRDDGATVQGRLAQQLEAAKAYLALMQARIPRLSFTLESEIDDAALPPLMLISMVENAIKHGVEPKIGSVHISVTARKLQRDGEQLLELTVADNGVGFGGATTGSGIGLANIRERLEATFGQRASLQLKVRPEGGIAAIIILPLLN